MLRVKFIAGLIASVLCTLIAGAQEFDTLSTNTISPKYLSAVANQGKALSNKLDKKSRKLMTAWEKQETKLIRLLSKNDSTAANRQNQLKEQVEILQSSLTISRRQYVPELDTLVNSLTFLQNNPQLLRGASGVTGQVNNAIKQVTELQEKFQQAEAIKKLIRERKQLLQAQLERFGLAKQLKKLNKRAYYYTAQVKAYKDLLKDPKKAQKKAIELLAKTKLFRDFMKKNSMLASLFRIAGDPGDPAYLASLAGLQTRAQVNNLIQVQLASGGPNAQQQFQQSIQQAQSELRELQNKILKSGGSSSDDDLPDFKPNNEKTKTFFQRLDIGANIQNQKSTNYFPTTSDLAFSVGYKLNEKSIIGIGGSYKIGWGRGWNHITVTNEGVGLRSFIDWKLKGSFWINGGYEQNHRTAFERFSVLKDRSSWQSSGLIGISKVMTMKTKLLKKTSLKIAWDFLSYQQLPKTQPIIFRIGYHFK